MLCPICGGRTSVVSTRCDCESVHRQRRCEDCKHLFYTAEYELDDLGQEYKRVRKERNNKNEFDTVNR